MAFTIVGTSPETYRSFAQVSIGTTIRMKLKLFNLIMIALFLGAQSNSVAEETTTSSASIVKKQVIAMSNNRDTNIYETVRDYIYALSKEPIPPESKLKSLIALKESLAKPSFSDIPRLRDASSILQDCHVRTISDLLMMQRALSALNGDCTHAQASMLYRIGLEVEQVQVTNAADKRAKVETLCILERLLRDDNEYGRKFALLTLKQIASDPTIPIEIEIEKKRFAVMQPLRSHIVEFPPRIGDGELYAAILHYAIKIAEQSPESVLDSPADFFLQLTLRCDVGTAARLQKELVESAVKLKMDESILSTLRAQLGYAYLFDGEYALAESAFRESAKNTESMPLIVQTLLAECLRLEGKLDDSSSLAAQIENRAKKSTEQYSNIYADRAKAIRAQNLISHGESEPALKLLQECEWTFSRTLGRQDLNNRKFPFNKAFPASETVMASEILLYRKLNRLQEVEQTQKKLDGIELEETKELTNRQETELFNLAKFQFSDEQALFNSKRYIDFCAISAPSVSEHKEKILSYAEELINCGSLPAAKFCLDECCKATNGISQSHRIADDRITIAELRGELDSAKRLLDDKSDLTNATQDDLLKTSELSATLSLLNGEYDRSESQSRLLETRLFSLNDVAESNDFRQTSQDQFAAKHAVGLLDRAQTLAHRRSFKEALVLLRRVLKIPSSDTALDAYALMAQCYQNTAHPGLALVAAQQSIDLLQASGYQPSPARLLADANFQLGQFALANGNKIRAQRYFTEALNIARDSHLTKTALYKEIELAHQS
jgi:hypothetical protein